MERLLRFAISFVDFFFNEFVNDEHDEIDFTLNKRRNGFNVASH